MKRKKIDIPAKSHTEKVTGLLDQLSCMYLSESSADMLEKGISQLLMSIPSVDNGALSILLLFWR